MSVRWPAPPHLVLTAYCVGVCTALAWRPGLPLLLLVFALAAAAAAGGAFTARRGLRAGGPLALLVLFAAVGAMLGGARLDSLARSALSAFQGDRIPLRAVVTDLPAIKDDQITLAVDIVRAAGREVDEPAHLRLRLDSGQTFALDVTGPLVEGAVIELAAAEVAPLPEPRPGQFDYGRYLRRRGERVLLDAALADLRIVGRRGGLQGNVDRLRLASRAHLQTGLRPPLSDVLLGMVLGDDEGVSPELVEDFRRSGLLHIMAVSGENVVLLCAMWSFVFALLGIHRLARTALLLPLVATYVLLTGASPSIVRAGVAGIFGLLAILASRPSDGWLLLLAPAAWLLTVNPNNLYDVSFQLSFAAVIGLLLLARPLTHAVRFLPGPLPEQVGVTTAASLATAPVSVLTFGSASLVSVPANVAGGFVLGPIMFLGMLSLLLGFVGTWCSWPLNTVAGLFIGFLLAVARLFGGLPGAVYDWQGVSVRLLLVLGFLSELAALALLASRAGAGLATYVRAPARRVTLIAVTAALAAAIMLAAPAPVRPPAEPTLTFLDVGEGAATLLQVPDGPTVLVDAGPAPLASTLRRHAVRGIDLLILSHGHADHVAGLADVIGGMAVRRALLPQPPQPAEALDRIAAQLTSAGADVRRCVAPLAIAGRGWSVRVLPTSAPPGADGNQGENDCALVVLVKLGGQRVLLPGDAEGPVLAALDLPPCAVVELPHHGSRGGFDAAELGALAPRLAVISVGPNSYGHPTAEMLDLLVNAGVPCARTDQHGEVAVSASARGLTVVAAPAG